jgi:hypothetical protein
VTQHFTRAATLVAVQLIPVIAQACPYCANRSDSHAWATAALIGSIVAMPYLAGAAVVRAVRKIEKDEKASTTPGTGGGNRS